MSLLGNALESNTAGIERKEAGLDGRNVWLWCNLNAIFFSGCIDRNGWDSGSEFSSTPRVRVRPLYLTLNSRWLGFASERWSNLQRGNFIWARAIWGRKAGWMIYFMLFLSTDLPPFKPLRSLHGISSYFCITLYISQTWSQTFPPHVVFWSWWSRY